MIHVLTAFITAVFTLGAAIFYVLSCVERSVLGLIFTKKNKRVLEDDIRFTHAALKRLSPLLPPSNGFVIFFGTLALIVQIILTDGHYFSILIPVVYWGVMLYIIFVKKIVQDVKHIKETPNDAQLIKVTDNVKRLIVQHHLGLMANIMVVVLELLFILLI